MSSNEMAVFRPWHQTKPQIIGKRQIHRQDTGSVEAKRCIYMRIYMGCIMQRCIQLTVWLDAERAPVLRGPLP